MYVLACNDSNNTCYLYGVTCCGVDNTNLIDYALKFTRDELDLFIPYLELILGMDFAYFYKIFEIKEC